MRKLGKVQRLAVWFWTEIQGNEKVNWVDPGFRRLLNQCSYMLTKMNLDAVKVQKAVELMVERGEMPASPNEIYLLKEPTTNKSWLEVVDDPMALAPPFYQKRETLLFLKHYQPDNPLIPELERELA